MDKHNQDKQKEDKQKDESTSNKIQSGKGIDIGTAFIKCAYKENNKVIYKKQRNAFFEIDQSDYSKNILDSHKIKYIAKDKELYVVGDDALEFASIFRKETRRPLSRGVISPTEKKAFPMIQLLIKSVIGEPSKPGEIAYYSVPSEPLDADLNVVYHRDIIGELLRNTGYKPKEIKEGYALILSELAEKEFTGIGISFGGGMVNVSFAYKSIPILNFSLAKGGDWIDHYAAQALNEPTSTVTRIKETNLDLDNIKELSSIESALSIFYNHLIEYLIEHLKQQLSKDEMPMIEKPITIVLAGGTSLPKGFVTRFKTILDRSSFPIAVGEIIHAANPVNAVSNGALVAALSDSENQ